MTRSVLDSLRPARSASIASVVSLLACVFVGCGLPNAAGPTRPLPSYVGHSTELFDDTIEPAAVGISLDVGVDPRSDRQLRERTQVGDAALRARITTITEKDDEGATRYVLGLHTVEMLAGPFPPGDTFEVNVGKSSPSAGLLKGLEGQIVGKTFVAFVREFVRPDGDRELHFHLAPDTKVEISAVKDAAALAGLQ
jgi:hypothetical protein